MSALISLTKKEAHAIARLVADQRVALSVAPSDADTLVADRALRELVAKHPEHFPRKRNGVCFVCGCSEFDACADGCAWANAEQTLCTACLAPKPSPRAGLRIARGGA